jgi:hypothetical protein
MTSTARSLPTGEQIRQPEAGMTRLHLFGPHSREFHQLLMQARVESRSVPAGDRLQRADDERGQPERHGAKRKQLRERGGGIASERVLYLGDRPPAEGDARELPPTETPPIARSVLFAPVVLGFPPQHAGSDPEKPRTCGKAVRIGALKEEDSDTFLLRKIAHTGIGYILYHIDARGSCDVQ